MSRSSRLSRLFGAAALLVIAIPAVASTWAPLVARNPDFWRVFAVGVIVGVLGALAFGIAVGAGTRDRPPQ